MIKHLVCCAVLVAGCGDFAATAARTVDQTNKVLLTTDARVRRTTRDALTLYARVEGRALGLELKRLGCPSGATSQPASAPAACRDAAAAAQARYDKYSLALLGAGLAADRVIDSLRVTLRLIVEVLEDLNLKAITEGAAVAKLTPLLASAAQMVTEMQAAYEQVRRIAQEVTP